MLYDYIKTHYKETEPIFFSDLELENRTKSALTQQLKTLCNQGLLMKYDKGIYYMPKTTLLHTTVGPNADMVARYRFISRGDRIEGFYSGNSFANQLGISTQVPRIVEIVSNNTNSSDRKVRIGNRFFYVKKPVVQIDYSYAEAKAKFAYYISIHGIRKKDVDHYIRKYPVSTFKYYYELELEHVLA